MTREDFAERYARRSGISVLELMKRGQLFLKCDCREEGCKGWQCVLSSSVEDLDAPDVKEAFKFRNMILVEAAKKYGWGIRGPE